jgi:hypothetical protein
VLRSCLLHQADGSLGHSRRPLPANTGIDDDLGQLGSAPPGPGRSGHSLCDGYWDYVDAVGTREVAATPATKGSRVPELGGVKSGVVGEPVRRRGTDEVGARQNRWRKR